MKTILFIASIVVQIIAVSFLATGAGLLAKPVIASMDLPWGILLTWLLFILFPLNFLIIRRNGSVHKIPRTAYRVCVYLSFMMGVLWLLVSYFLAGNWTASFGANNSNENLWRTYTFAVPLLPFIGYLLMRLLMIFFRVQKVSSRS